MKENQKKCYLLNLIESFNTLKIKYNVIYSTLLPISHPFIFPLTTIHTFFLLFKLIISIITKTKLLKWQLLEYIMENALNMAFHMRVQRQHGRHDLFKHHLEVQELCRCHFPYSWHDGLLRYFSSHPPWTKVVYASLDEVK